MRILIKLKSEKYCVYDSKYYHKLRGFIYSLQKDSLFFNRHELKDYKFFSFSNIFPANDMRHGSSRSLIISSPSKDFIYYLRGRLCEMQETNKKVEVGEAQFSVSSIQNLQPKVNKNTKLITGTPIVLRIPKEKYTKYGIESQRQFEYWKPEIDFNAYLSQLSGNLIKKYNSYHNVKIKNNYLFQQFKFKKAVCVHRIENGREIKTVGTLWEFAFEHLTEEQQKILQLGLDSGFGELNSGGFGFMNVVR